MCAYQFLDFNPTGPVWVKQEIPVPRCQEIIGCPKKSKSKLGLRFQEAQAPFYLQFPRYREGEAIAEVPSKHKRGECSKSHSSGSCCH